MHLSVVIPDLLFNQYLRVMCINMCFCMKERKIERKEERALKIDNARLLATVESFFVGDNECAIK